MRGVISITDRNWFQFLSAQSKLDEVNFWRPRDTEKPSFDSGTPILFKLKKQHGDCIVGYGIFARHSVLPAWMAWEAFGMGNGAESFAQMRQRLEHLRRDDNAARSPGDYLIGCLMLSTPVFFGREDWIAPPGDWSPNIVQGKTYDLLSGEGGRVWESCRLLTRVGEPARAAGQGVAEPDPPRYGVPAMVAPRLGQGTFRIAVTDAYRRACAVTTEHSLPVLEAAHIRPYADEGVHLVSNGLLLRTDIHRLFDRGYVTVMPDDHRFVVSRRLKEDFENGRTYYALHGSPIHLPEDPTEHPAREHLEWHARERFLG